MIRTRSSSSSLSHPSKLFGHNTTTSQTTLATAQLSCHPTEGKSEAKFRVLRQQIPVLTDELFYNLFCSYQESVVEVVNYKTDARHCLEIKEAAAWILSGIQ